MNKKNVNLAFLKSAVSLRNNFNDLPEVKHWLKELNQRIFVNIKKIDFEELDQWHFTENNLKHYSGKFFSIDGIKVKTNYGHIKEWEQPIINQPEIGYLGFITKEFNGVLHFLMQAKIEPGNVNSIQLSPTLQATKSNYTQVHQGKVPAYLSYFLRTTPDQILLDQLQSEQGARFLRKRNRNIIIKIDDDIPVLENFKWLTLAQIKLLMLEDNLVNMDTRTVISGVPFGNCQTLELNNFLKEWIDSEGQTINFPVLQSMMEDKVALHSIDEIIRFITSKKCGFELNVEKIPLKAVSDWIIEKDRIRHSENKFFQVIATKVEIANREVVTWTQPMIQPAQEGICAFICKEINGILHFIVQAKLEAGNFDIIEFAPTVQCLTGNYRMGISSLPFLEYVLTCSEDQILFNTFQSEEGGRFYKEQNRNLIVLADDNFPIELPENYIWMTLNQLQTFIKFNNYINIQARSLIAAVSFTNSKIL